MLLGSTLTDQAILTDTPLHGAFMDFAKCFDSLPQGLLFKLAAEMGLSPRVLVPLQGMYDSLRRRFCLGASLGSEWTATNGILQGCPLSVFLLNALMAVWSRAVDASSPIDQNFVVRRRPRHPCCDCRCFAVWRGRNSGVRTTYRPEAPCQQGQEFLHQPSSSGCPDFARHAVAAGGTAQVPWCGACRCPRAPCYGQS